MGDALDRLVSLSTSDVDDEDLLVVLGRLERKPGKQNWVDQTGGLPAYIEKIAVALHERRGMTISRAIATAVDKVKEWASGRGNVDPDTRAKAVKALAEWEAKKARAHAKPNKK